jgi:hypothetical protein
MKSITKKAGLLAAAFVVCLAGSARAATIEVKVPFPFLVHGKTLPAGEYRVENTGSVVLFRGEKGNRASMFVMTAPAGGYDPAGDMPAPRFTRYEKQYRLGHLGIWLPRASRLVGSRFPTKVNRQFTLGSRLSGQITVAAMTSPD